MSSALLTGIRTTLLLLLHVPGASGRENEPVEGMTRLQKMLFLLIREYDVVKRVGQLEFEAYSYGPYSPRLYDEIAFLENQGFLAGFEDDVKIAYNKKANELSYEFLMSGTTAERPARDTTEISEDQPEFDYLLRSAEVEIPERYETRKFALSKKGVGQVASLLRRASADPNLEGVLAALEDVKTRFNKVPLLRLVRYVYEKYPESARESVIADRVLRR